MIVGIDFEFIRILMAASMLGSAAFFDIRKREVSDLLWICFGVIALAVYVLEFIYEATTFDLFPAGVPILIAAAVSFGIYKTGLFGGADALALVTLTIILPTYDGGLGRINSGDSVFLLQSIVPLIVLSNAVILSMSMIVLNLLSNATFAYKNPGKLFEGLEHESKGKKILALAIGHRTKAVPSYSFPIEQEVEGRRQFNFAPAIAESAEYELRKDTWVTRGIPFLVFMLAGFVVMLLIGDLVAMAFSIMKLL